MIDVIFLHTHFSKKNNLTVVGLSFEVSEYLLLDDSAVAFLDGNYLKVTLVHVEYREINAVK
jgi:hypothetical protein